MKPCPKCKGTGWIEFYSHVSKGVCFKCLGTGLLTKPEREAIKRKREEKERKNAIPELKIQLAVAYNSIHHGLIKSDTYQKQKRKEAQSIWNKLKELDAAPSCEEIKEIAAGLRVWEQQINQMGMMERMNVKTPTLEELKMLGNQGV